jgi:hypothetical protein
MLIKTVTMLENSVESGVKHHHHNLSYIAASHGPFGMLKFCFDYTYPVFLFYTYYPVC